MELEKIIRDKHLTDNEQLEFIFSNDKKIVVTAPAGCGKTTAMVSKIAWELSNGYICNNKKVLAMTFSVNAATKIKDSLEEFMPKLIKDYDYNKIIKRVDVANYHNFAMKLLYRYGYLLNEEFKNLNEFDIITDDSEKLKSYINNEDNNNLIEFDNAIKLRDSKKILELFLIYQDIFIKKLFPKKIITYNAILVFAIVILQTKRIADFYKIYYKMIIIDEFQDTNYLSLMLVYELIGDNKIIFLGDDIQKIYSFLGAIDGLVGKIIRRFDMKEIKFLNNYRFKDNIKMKELDTFVRSYSENYVDSGKTAHINAKILSNENDENTFIVKGINKILKEKSGKIAILVKWSKHSNTLLQLLDSESVPYFNAVFKDTDIEYEKFHKYALDRLYTLSNSKKSLTKELVEQLKVEVSNSIEIICNSKDNEYIFYSLYRLFEELIKYIFSKFRSSKDRYERFETILINNSLKNMMEYIEEPVIITTVHASKGLEWDYVVIPRMMSYNFSPYCTQCRQLSSSKDGYNYCEFLFSQYMKENFKNELSVFYVGITRAKKDIFVTANNGKNDYGYPNKLSCFLTLKGLKLQDFNW